jgi:hypothetical protein
MSTDHPRPRATCRSRTRVHTPQGELQQLKAPWCPGHPSMVGVATFRLSTSPLHRHCYSSQQDELRTRIAGQRACRAGAHRPCSQASVRTGPAGIPVRGYVDVRAHTREARVPRAYRSCAPLPPALPSSSCSLSVSDSWQKNCPQLSDPTNFGLVFRSPQDSRGLWGAHEQYLSTPWAPRHADLCMWKPERRSFTHSRSHARSLDRAFFRSQSETSRPYMRGGGRTGTTNRLSENHL